MPVILYTEAPFANNVTSEMSFNEAFSTAREELGQGGFFEWRGNTYNTYTGDEWEALNSDQQQAFMNSVHENTSYSTAQDVADIALVDGTVIMLDGVAIGTDGQPFTGNYGGLEYQDGQSLWVDDSIVILDGVAVDATNQPFTGSYGAEEYINGVLVGDADEAPIIVTEDIIADEEIVVEPDPIPAGDGGSEIPLDINQDNIVDAIAINTDGDEFIEVIAVDSDFDGAVDTYYVDTDDNNTLDTVIIDDMQDGYQGDEPFEILEAEQVVNMSDLEDIIIGSTADSVGEEIPEDLPEIDNDADISGFV